tara:strand:+ start:6406 stop:6825 length:420 start_codon:yes stop_codon:yes gene_type:complete
MLVTLNRATSKMFKRVILLLVLIMSVSFANANNENDKKNDSKIEKVESNKQLDVLNMMFKNHSKKSLVITLSLIDTTICTGGNGEVIYSSGGKFYLTTLPVQMDDGDGTGELAPPIPPTEQNFNEINAICTAPGGSWES